MNFGNKIKQLRIDKQWTQEFVAKQLNISMGALSRYETGMYEPKSLDLIKDFSILFEVSTDYLLGKEENNNKQDLTDKLFLIPIVGRVPAGEPLLADENIEGYLPIDPIMYNLTSPDNLFFLRVVGESMNKVVSNGSFVLVKKQDYAETGDVVVALVNGDNEATLKKFKDLDNNFVMLEPDSTYPEYTPRIVNLRDTEFKIIGKVIGDFKKWS